MLNMNWLCLSFCVALVLSVALVYVFCAPAVDRAARVKWMRDHPIDTVALFFFTVVMVLYGGSKATTNNPPETAEGPTKTIRLYYTSADGRLVPLGARLKGEGQ